MEHTPVLLDECIEGLSLKPGGVYVDGTLGHGGHARELVKRLDAEGRLIVIDRDADAIKEAKVNLSEFEGKITFVHGDFADIKTINDVQKVDGMLFDLGVSSPQLDDPERGFSYMQNAPLDMRMDKDGALTAFEAVNTWPEEKLRKIFFEYGEEKYSRQIVRAIVKKRGEKLVATTFDLNEIIISALPPKARREKQHPSKRCFQALRIAVNDELGAITGMLDAAPEMLKPGGRICVISYHSLEDRLVKTAFNARVSGCVCPKDVPVCVCGFVPTLKLITKKPITPGAFETERNPRARSAKLRIAERI
jgi:16S rRNA (cytosine1402-N4)-methyltransferase